MTAIAPAQSPSSPKEPDSITMLNLEGAHYKIFAFIQQPDGSRTYLSTQSFTPENLDKIRELAGGVLKAHDCRRLSLKEAPYEIKKIDAYGLTKTDGAVISHDFDLAPIAPPSFIDKVSSSLAKAGKPVQSSAIKTRDIWNALEGVVHQEMGSKKDITRPTSQASRPPETVHAVAVNTQNTRHLDWYEEIPGPRKIRLIDDILNKCCCSPAGIHRKIWERFESQYGPASEVIKALEAERNSLKRHHDVPTTTIPVAIRAEANSLIAEAQSQSPPLSDENIRNKVNFLMHKEFLRKEGLLRLSRQRAIREGVAIEEWDQDWAQHHFADDLRRFISVLSEWLDQY